MTKNQPTHDIVCKSGTFIGRDGKERWAYRKIGVAWADENGFLNKQTIEVMPLNWNGESYFRLREEKPMAEGEALQAASAAGTA